MFRGMAFWIRNASRSGVLLRIHPLTTTTGERVTSVTVPASGETISIVGRGGT